MATVREEKTWNQAPADIPKHNHNVNLQEPTKTLTSMHLSKLSPTAARIIWCRSVGEVERGAVGLKCRPTPNPPWFYLVQTRGGVSILRQVRKTN